MTHIYALKMITKILRKHIHSRQLKTYTHFEEVPDSQMFKVRKNRCPIEWLDSSAANIKQGVLGGNTHKSCKEIFDDFRSIISLGWENCCICIETADITSLIDSQKLKIRKKNERCPIDWLDLTGNTHKTCKDIIDFARFIFSLDLEDSAVFA